MIRVKVKRKDRVRYSPSKDRERECVTVLGGVRIA